MVGENQDSDGRRIAAEAAAWLAAQDQTHWVGCEVQWVHCEHGNRLIDCTEPWHA